MYISQQLKKKNIAEYLLYMWQVEDLIRANGCDMERIRKNIIEPYPATDEQKKELARWYEDLINMMQQEGVLEKGHVQINKNIIVWLTDLHLRLLRSMIMQVERMEYFHRRRVVRGRTKNQFIRGAMCAVR